MSRTAWLSSVAAAAILAGASAPSLSTAAPIPAALSYSDLLDSVPDAATRLAVDDAIHEQDVRLQTVQYWGREHHHHHHHYHHHHHSWQGYPDNGYYWSGGSTWVTPYYTQEVPWYGGPGAYAYDWRGAVPVPYEHHHHHHHHHHDSWRRW